MDDVSCVGTDKKVHPFKKDGVCCIYVGFSSVSCHDCHEKLNTYLDEAGFYDNDTIEIYGIIALEKDKIKNEFYQQLSIVSMKQYYPKMKQFRFCEEIDKDIKIVGRRIKNFYTPFVLRVYQYEYFSFDANMIFTQNDRQQGISELFKERLTNVANLTE